MSPPLLQVNNFIQPKSKIIRKNKNYQIDLLSKMYIVLGLIMGINRMSLVSSSKTLFILMICYYVFTNVVLFYAFFSNITIWSDYFTILDVISFFMCTTLSGLCHTRLCKFYNKLNKFDDDIGFKTKVPRGAHYNIWAYLVTVGLSMLLFLYYNIYTIPLDETKSALFLICAPSSKILQALELHYYGHLFSLVIPRLKLITNYFKITYPNPHRERDDNDYSSQEFKKLIKQQHKYSHVDLQKLITFYDKIINIYDDLNSAIKWQMVSLLATTFINILVLSFTVVTILISGVKSPIFNASFVCVCVASLVIKLAHIVVPCAFADRVHSAACTLREILACRLYENTLDKSGRSSARILLALIETRDLSFSLFHMINVDLSLPFKFLGLLLTYLVILLQFDKVTNS